MSRKIAAGLKSLDKHMVMRSVLDDLETWKSSGARIAVAHMRKPVRSGDATFEQVSTKVPGQAPLP